ncbi:DUF3221 domain-containing protein [Microbacteriaceae bacterium 4G12]
MMIVMGITFIAVLLLIKIVPKDSNSTRVSKNDTSMLLKGYIVLKEDLVYFVEEDKVDQQNIQADLEKLTVKEHPSDARLVFDDQNAAKNLLTGDKVKIGVKQILESYPARIIVTKLEKVDA